MSVTPFRFLHAGGFRLDQPMGGLPELPDHLVGPLIDAPYRAAERLFEAALREQVAFVVLAGDLLDLKCPSARALAFLQEQFQHLDAARIPVFWAGTHHDSAADWPREVALPGNVQHFPDGQVATGSVDLGSGGRVLILGQSASGQDRFPVKDFQPDPSCAFSVAVVPGPIDLQQAVQHPIHYWAVGGAAARQELLSEPCLAHCAGTTQGRSPAEIGARGGTLVDVNAAGTAKLRLIECDAAQWISARVVVGSIEPRSEIHQVLTRHVERFQSAAAGKTLLVCWQVVIQDAAGSPATFHQLASELAAWLRNEFGQGENPCWPVTVRVMHDDQILPSWREEDTLLGDYLRAAQELEADGALGIHHLLAATEPNSGSLAEFSDLADPDTRCLVLQRATALGARLLRGDDQSG